MQSKITTQLYFFLAIHKKSVGSLCNCFDCICLWSTNLPFQTEDHEIDGSKLHIAFLLIPFSTSNLFVVKTIAFNCLQMLSNSEVSSKELECKQQSLCRTKSLLLLKCELFRHISNEILLLRTGFHFLDTKVIVF